jgi:hypothetical protein
MKLFAAIVLGIISFNLAIWSGTLFYSSVDCAFYSSPKDYNEAMVFLVVGLFLLFLAWRIFKIGRLKWIEYFISKRQAAFRE